VLFFALVLCGCHRSFIVQFKLNIFLNLYLYIFWCNCSCLYFESEIQHENASLTFPFILCFKTLTNLYAWWDFPPFFPRKFVNYKNFSEHCIHFFMWLLHMICQLYLLPQNVKHTWTQWCNCFFTLRVIIRMFF
jgi:hypothetical protein